MRVLVDRELCEGNGRCAAVAPEVFVLDEEDKSQVINATPPVSLHEKVRLAARLCPRQAITIEECE